MFYYWVLNRFNYCRRFGYFSRGDNKKQSDPRYNQHTLMRDGRKTIQVAGSVNIKSRPAAALVVTSYFFFFNSSCKISNSYKGFIAEVMFILISSEPDLYFGSS